MKQWVSQKMLHKGSSIQYLVDKYYLDNTELTFCWRTFTLQRFIQISKDYTKVYWVRRLLIIDIDKLPILVQILSLHYQYLHFHCSLEYLKCSLPRPRVLLSRSSDGSSDFTTRTGPGQLSSKRWWRYLSWSSRMTSPGIFMQCSANKEGYFK